MRLHPLFIASALALTACAEMPPPPPPPVVEAPPAPPPNPFRSNEQIYEQPSLSCAKPVQARLELYPDEGTTYKMRAMDCGARADDVQGKLRAENLPDLHPPAMYQDQAGYQAYGPSGLTGKIYVTCTASSDAPRLIAVSLFRIAPATQDSKLHEVQAQLQTASEKFCRNGVANRPAVIDTGRALFGISAPRPPVKKPAPHKPKQLKK